MNSSISSSSADPPQRVDPWRRFFLSYIASAAGLGAFVYAFIFIIDPFDTLAFSPNFDRAPIASNARYSFPALARSPRFDSVIIGTSTSRELQPAVLNPLFDARFANLAMNSALPYEQNRLLTLFARHHPDAKAALIGIDDSQCVTGETYEKYTPRPFPEWMYDENPWNDFAEMFNLHAVEQAGRQFGVLTGLHKPFFGRDGYTNFLPDESRYDLAKVRRILATEHDAAVAANRARPPLPPAGRAALNFPNHPLLEAALGALPSSTRKLIFFVPYYLARQPEPGTTDGMVWAECKTRIAGIVADVPNAIGLDFMIDSPITREESNYWDVLHYRVGIGVRIAHDLAAANAGEVPARNGDYVALR